MNKHLYLPFLLSFVSYGQPLYGQDVHVSATVNTNLVQLNQSFTYQVTVETPSSAEVSEPRLPALEGLDFLSRTQSQSHQTSVVITNGQMETTRINNKVFTYTFQAKKQGTFVILPTQIHVDGVLYQTNQIQITVQKDPVPQSQQKTRPGKGLFFNFDEDEDIFSQFFGTPDSDGEDAQDSLPLDVVEDAFFIHVEVDKDRVYVGEQIIVAWYLYTKYHITDIDTLKYPLLKGFWKEDLQIATRLSFTQEIQNGIVYKKALLAKYALFPMNVGMAQIDPYEVQGRVVANSLFSRFGFGRSETYKDASEQINIQVKSLPAEGRMEHFSGAVGQYDLKISKPENQTPIKVDEPFHYVLRFEGRGNAKRIGRPTLNLPEGLESYDTKTASEYFEDGRSYKEFDFLLIPRKAGLMSIPSFQFSYFDPSQERYIQKDIPAWQANVLPGQRLQESSHTFKTRPEASVLEDRLPDPEVLFSMPLLSQKTKKVLWVLVYLLLLFILIGKVFRDFGWKARSSHFTKDMEKRWKLIYQKEAQGQFRDMGVLALKLIQESLSQISTQSGVTIQELLEQTPPRLRKKLEKPILTLSKQFEALSFSSHSVIDKKQIQKDLKELEALLRDVFKDK